MDKTPVPADNSDAIIDAALERAWRAEAEVEQLREEIRLTLMYGTIDYDRLKKVLGI